MRFYHSSFIIYHWREARCAFGAVCLPLGIDQDETGYECDEDGLVSFGIGSLERRAGSGQAESG